MASPVRIDELMPPTGVDGSEAADFRATVELAARIANDFWGHDDFRIGPAAALAGARSTDYERRHTLVARTGSRIVGQATLELPLADNTHLGYVNVQVHPDFRRRGVGSHLLATAEARISAAGRSTTSGWSEHHPPQAGVDVLVPATGIGAIFGGEPAAKFAMAHGFVLEQVERISRLDLPPVLPAAGGDGEGPADGYELVSWDSECPDGLVEEYAGLRRQMSLDVPLGQLDVGEEVWDVARVREDEQLLRDKEAQTLVTASRYVPDGTLTGHSVLEHYADQPEVVFQGDTLVLAAHRGHGLGQWMKRNNLRRLAMEWPQVRRIYTFNAAENARMLAINVALGFRVAGLTGLWQKRLPHE